MPNICVFCMNEVQGHVCTRCREYKGVEEAWRCECGALMPKSCERCEDCGKNQPSQRSEGRTFSKSQLKLIAKLEREAPKEA